MTHIATITVCRYILDKMKMSNRAVARALGIHHRTWQRYVGGESSPTPHIKYKMVKLMRAENYMALINTAFAHYREKRSVLDITKTMGHEGSLGK
ncbi:MAG: helix-turn-helix transcriptional regulator [Flavobacteriales bacterium]